MSHEIETFENGAAAFVSARTDAWHRLGTVLPDCFTAEQAMTTALLGGWNVRKTPITTAVITDDGVSTLEVPDRYATVRTHPVTGQPDVLGVVGDGYVPVQNEEHCELLDLIVDESGAHFQTAGSLLGGRQVFVSMLLPDTMLVGGVDAVRLYLLAVNSHDGSRRFTLVVTPIRAVCWNTVSMALARARSSFAIRHTSGVKGRIAEARQALDMTFKYTEALQAEADKLVNSALSEAEYMRVVAQVFPEPKSDSKRSENTHTRALDTLRALFTAETQANVAGTRWAGLQAITEYLDHVQPVRAKGGKDTARAARTLTAGWIAETKQHAYDLLKV